MQQGEHAFLDTLAAAARREILARSRTLRARKGQTVLARGESSQDVFIVQEGRLRVILYAADGREVSLRELSEGQLFGELAAIDGQERSVAVIALTQCRLIVISAEAFRTAVRENPDAAEWLNRRLAAQIRSLTNRVFELSALSVRARLHCELMRMARANGEGATGAEPGLAPTHAELASRIGTHREAVTRELKDLADQKIIRHGRRRLEFLDLARLEHVVAASLRAPVGEETGW